MTEACCKTFIASTDIPQYARVKVLSTGKVGLAAAGDEEHGIAERAVLADEAVAVRLRNSIGTGIAIAKVAIAVGDDIYGDASGKVGKTNTNAVVGVALSAASADGDYIEFLRS